MRVGAKGEVTEKFNEMKPELYQEFSYQLSPHLSMKFFDTQSNIATQSFIAEKVLSHAFSLFCRL